VVQVIDELPADSTEKNARNEPLAGSQLMVRGEIMRAKFRNSWETPEAITPGKPTRVKFELNDVLHTFKKGHRIVVRVMSAWFPIADRNPNTFVSRAQAKDSDFKAADIQILTGGSTASRIDFGALGP
jgi:predicted acyl esterase